MLFSRLSASPWGVPLTVDAFTSQPAPFDSKRADVTQGCYIVKHVQPISFRFIFFFFALQIIRGGLINPYHGDKT